MNQIAPKNLLWLEDRPDTVNAELTWVKTQPGIKLRLHSGLTGLKNDLDEWQSNPAAFPIIGIILDIQMFGVPSLKPFIDDKLIDFLPNDAGWMIAEYVFRRVHSPYEKIPLMIMTVQSLKADDRRRLEKLKQRPGTGSSSSEVIHVEKSCDNIAHPTFVSWVADISKR